MTTEVVTNDTALEALAANPAVNIFKNPQSEHTADPFWASVAARAREGVALHVLNREHAGRALIHAAAERPVDRSVLNGEEIMRVASACLELQTTNIHFYSYIELADFLNRRDLDREDVVVAMDLRADGQDNISSLNQSLLLSRLAKFLQLFPECSAILAVDA